MNEEEMNLRDRIAIHAMQGLLSCDTLTGVPKEIAKVSYEYADAMIQQRGDIATLQFHQFFPKEKYEAIVLAVQLASTYIQYMKEHYPLQHSWADGSPSADIQNQIAYAILK